MSRRRKRRGFGPTTDRILAARSSLLLAILLWGILLFRCDRASAGEGTTRISLGKGQVEADGASGEPTITADGRFVTFTSAASNLVDIDHNRFVDVFVRDRDPDGDGLSVGVGATRLVSVGRNGVSGNGPSYRGEIAGRGRFVAFESGATNLIPNDQNGHTDIFLRDLLHGETELVSLSWLGTQGFGPSRAPAISPDGRYVVFESSAANLVPKLPQATQIYLRDRWYGVTELVSVNEMSVPANDANFAPSLSADGRFVAFVSFASNLVASGSSPISGIYVRDRSENRVIRASRSSSGQAATGPSFSPRMSADGRHVVFASLADNLAPGAGSGLHIYSHALETGITTLVSQSSASAVADGTSNLPSISETGRFVTFMSDATNLSATDGPGFDLFLRDRLNGTTEVVSSRADTGVAVGHSAGCSMVTFDRRFVAFESAATDLVEEPDRNGVVDVFVREFCPAGSVRSYGAGWPGTFGVPRLLSQGAPSFGRPLRLEASNSFGVATPGTLLLGVVPAASVTPFGGSLLVEPMVVWPLGTVRVEGMEIGANLPADPALCGVSLYTQLLLEDLGASHGLAFSAGLELIFGS